MKIKALITLIINGKEVAPGTGVDIFDGEAQRLMDRGFAVTDKGAKAPSKPAKKPEPQPLDPFSASDGEDNAGTLDEKEEGPYDE